MSGTLFGLFDMFSGGGLSNVSVFALGIMPYISASIIMQLVQVISPEIKRLAKEEGQAGRRKITQYTRYLTVGLALINSIGYLFLFKSSQYGLDFSGLPFPAWIEEMKQEVDRAKGSGYCTRAVALVSKRTAEKITAPRASYVAEVSVEKGSTLDGDTVLMKLTAEKADPVIRVDLTDVKQEVKQGTVMQLEADSWERPSVKVVEVGLTLEGHPYADLEINKDAVYAMGSVGAMMKNDIKVRLNARSQESTCLLPASAVRGSGSDRYVYVGTMENSTFGGSRMVAEKKTVTVLAESGSTVSVSEDLSYDKVLYMEDRALTEGGAVMEYARTSEK
jgi:hypothetical protein